MGSATSSAPMPTRTTVACAAYRGDTRFHRWRRPGALDERVDPEVATDSVMGSMVWVAPKRRAISRALGHRVR